MPSRFNYLFFLFILLTAKGYAQSQPMDSSMHVQRSTDSVSAMNQPRVLIGDSTRRDTLIKKKKIFEPIPKKAGLFSAILPGLGQVYDRQYWKVPVVYAGVGIAAYFINFNAGKYQTYRKAYIAEIDNSPNTINEFKDIYTRDQLKTLQDEYKRYLDLTILATTIGYAAHVIDAIVYAHLRNFEMTRDISMNLHPVIAPNYAGMMLTVRLK